jgi:hypothetical protein
LRLAPPPFGSPGSRFPKNFVAMTMRSRRVRLLPIVALAWDGGLTTVEHPWHGFLPPPF